MNKTILLFNFILNGNYRKIYITIFISIASSILEMISIGLILPLLYLVNSNQHNLFLNLETFSISLNLTTIVILFGIFSLIAGVFRVYQIRWNSELAFSMGKILNSKLYNNFLNFSYSDFIKLDKTNILDTITKKTDSVIYGTVLQVINLISSFILLLFIILLTFIVNPIVSISTFFVIGIIYCLIILTTKYKLRIYGDRMHINNSSILKILKETVGIFRDIKLDSSQRYFIEKFSYLDSQLRVSQSNINFLTSFPRYAIEYCALVIISFVILLGIKSESNIKDLIPTLILIAIAGQRLMPIIQMIYSAISNIISSKSSLESIINLLEYTNKTNIDSNSSFEFANCDSLILNNISYSNSNGSLFSNINLEVPFGATIGIIGKSGIGKSTLFDLIMGLTPPSSGNLLINNTPIFGGFINSYQKILSHVPQNIYIIDGTILDNILLDKSSENIDFDQLNLAIKVSELDIYVNNLNDGINTYIGSEGSLISGGQKQRIGIARAVYRKSKIIFLDEATSALDKDTEYKVFDNLRFCLPNTTVVIITHNYLNLRYCNYIYKIENKSLKKLLYENI